MNRLTIDKLKLARFETRIEKGGKLEENKNAKKGNARTFYRLETDKVWRDRNGNPSSIYKDASPSNAFASEFCEVYRDYALYAPTIKEDGTEEYSREKPVGLRGLMIDIDVASTVHGKETQTKETVEQILNSTEFNSVPWYMIVSTGNGFQVHFIFDTVYFEEREAGLKEWKERLASLKRRIETEFNLVPDKNASSLNCNYRRPSTANNPKWNCKLMKDAGDIQARKPVVIWKKKEATSTETLAYLNECLLNYGEPAEIKTPKMKSLPDDLMSRLDASGEKVREALFCIPPESLDYMGWVSVGMALHHWNPALDGEGFRLFDEWSRLDGRYNGNEMTSKWNSFSGGGKITLGTLFHLAKENGFVPSVPKRTGTEFFLVPRTRGDETPTLSAGNALAVLFEKEGRFFMDGMGDLVRLQIKNHFIQSKEKLSVASLASAIEELATPVQLNSDGAQDFCSVNDKLLKDVFASEHFKEQLPKLKTVLPCPVLNVMEGVPEIITGYNRNRALFASGSLPALPVPKDSIAVLLELLEDFNFVSPEDKATAFALLLAPAILWGDLLNGRVPGFIIEADDSQAGKGYLCKIVCEIWNVKPEIIAAKENGKGAGCLEDSFSFAVSEGLHPVVQIDNMRGLLQSQQLETFMTENSFTCRHAYSREKKIDPTRHLILMTSNRVELISDTANRFASISIRKQEPGYAFRRWMEGGTVEHIKANRERYQGAALSILSNWVQAGKPKLQNADGSAFSEFWKSTDKICEGCGLARPSAALNGNRERLSSPELIFLRSLAIEGERHGLQLEGVKVSRLIMAGVEMGIENQWTTGLTIDSGGTEGTVLNGRAKALSKSLERHFKTTTEKEMEGFIFRRENRMDREQGREFKAYTIARKDRKGTPSLPPEPIPEPIAEPIAAPVREPEPATIFAALNGSLETLPPDGGETRGDSKGETNGVIETRIVPQYLPGDLDDDWLDKPSRLLSTP